MSGFLFFWFLLLTVPSLCLAAGSVKEKDAEFLRRLPAGELRAEEEDGLLKCVQRLTALGNTLSINLVKIPRVERRNLDRFYGGHFIRLDLAATAEDGYVQAGTFVGALYPDSEGGEPTVEFRVDKMNGYGFLDPQYRAAQIREINDRAAKEIKNDVTWLRYVKQTNPEFLRMVWDFPGVKHVVIGPSNDGYMVPVFKVVIADPDDAHKFLMRFGDQFRGIDIEIPGYNDGSDFGRGIAVYQRNGSKSSRRLGKIIDGTASLPVVAPDFNKLDESLKEAVELAYQTCGEIVTEGPNTYLEFMSFETKVSAVVDFSNAPERLISGGKLKPVPGNPNQYSGKLKLRTIIELSSEESVTMIQSKEGYVTPIRKAFRN